MKFCDCSPWLLGALLLSSLVACSPNLPSVDETISANARQAPFPELVSLPALLDEADRGSKIEAEADALAARVARLKARATALRGRSIVDGQTRLKLVQAVAARGY